MALQIIENNGTFYIDGKINTTTTRNFIIHFDYILDVTEKVIINIEKIKEIDEDGWNALRILNKIAVRSNKIFSIEGNPTKEKHSYLLEEQVA